MSKYLVTFSDVARRGIGLLEKFATLLSAISVSKMIILERFSSISSIFVFFSRDILLCSVISMTKIRRLQKNMQVRTYVCIYSGTFIDFLKITLTCDATPCNRLVLLPSTLSRKVHFKSREKIKLPMKKNDLLSLMTFYFPYPVLRYYLITRRVDRILQDLNRSLRLLNNYQHKKNAERRRRIYSRENGAILRMKDALR